MKKLITSVCVVLGVLSSMLLSSCSMSGILTPDKTPPSYVAMEVNSGRILYASNANVRRPIGMLTNLATAVVVMDWVKAHNVNLNMRIQVPEEAVKWHRTNLLKLRPGDSITLRDALYSALLWDDSACATTAAYACGYVLNPSDPEEAFIGEMNNLARRLGMVSTYFKGSNGAVITQSSARDMALMGMYAINNPHLLSICSQRSVHVTVHSMFGDHTHTLRNNNRLLGSAWNVDGLKVGQSLSAGSCLMVTSRRASVKRINPLTGKESTYGQRLLVVVLGMPTTRVSYGVAAKFLRDGWDAWDKWLPSNDYHDRTKFIILPD